jgi:predicted acetyltransferase
MPNPVPVAILERIAVDQSFQGKGLGRALIGDAGKRVIQAADSIGIRGLVVQALSAEAKTFYEKVGFDPSPLDPMILMITLADLKASLESRLPEEQQFPLTIHGALVGWAKRSGENT